MTEEEWLSSNSCGAMLRVIPQKCPDFARRNRTLRLLAIYVLRDIAEIAPSPAYGSVLDEVERHLTEGASRATAQAAIREACIGYESVIDARRDFAQASMACLRGLLDDVAVETAVRAVIACDLAQIGNANEFLKHDLTRTAKYIPRIRELFGNPFRPVTFDPAWRTSTAIGLAQTMYDARHFNAMPILADALQDAGCENEDILNHCRDETVEHVRGCWVVDLVLDRRG